MAKIISKATLRPNPDNPQSGILAITDASGVTDEYLLSSESVQMLAPPVLGLLPVLASQYPEPETSLESLIGTRSALHANRVVIDQGQHAQEAAVRIFLGKVELTFLIPLDELILSLQNLTKLIKRETIQ
jgi:hypothetical protein